MVVENRFIFKLLRFNKQIEYREVEKYIEKESIYNILNEAITNDNFNRIRFILSKCMYRSRVSMENVLLEFYKSSIYKVKDNSYAFTYIYDFCFPIFHTNEKIEDMYIFDFILLHNRYDIFMFLVEEGHELYLNTKNHNIKNLKDRYNLI